MQIRQWYSMLNCRSLIARNRRTFQYTKRFQFGQPVLPNLASRCNFIAVVLPSLDTNTPKVTFNNGEPNLNAATQSLKTPREIPTGTVVFKDSGTPIGTGTLDKLGIATLTYSLLPVGNHNITAVYSGDSNFASSISNVIVQKILSKTIITWPTKPNPCKFGQTCTFTLRIEVQSSGAGTPTGTVSFYDGFKSLGNCGLSDSGLASFSTDKLTIGSHNIIAVYSGDGNFNTCSGTFIQTITAK